MLFSFVPFDSLLQSEIFILSAVIDLAMELTGGIQPAKTLGRILVERIAY